MILPFGRLSPKHYKYGGSSLLYGAHLICKFDDLRRLVDDAEDQKKKN